MRKPRYLWHQHGWIILKPQSVILFLSSALFCVGSFSLRLTVAKIKWTFSFSTSVSGDATRNSSACVIPNYPVNTENVHVEVGHAAISLRGAADYGIEISNHHSVSKLFGGSSTKNCCQKKWRECCGGAGQSQCWRGRNRQVSWGCCLASLARLTNSGPIYLKMRDSVSKDKVSGFCEGISKVDFWCIYT